MPKRTSTRAHNKSEFVRNMPEGMSAAEVVAKAKAEGMDLTPGHVYTIRAAAKRKGAPAAGGRRGRPARASSDAGRAPASGSAEQQFIGLALDLGLSRAEALLSRIRAGVRDLS